MPTYCEPLSKSNRYTFHRRLGGWGVSVVRSSDRYSSSRRSRSPLSPPSSSAGATGFSPASVLVEDLRVALPPILGFGAGGARLLVAFTVALKRGVGAAWTQHLPADIDACALASLVKVVTVWPLTLSGSSGGYAKCLVEPVEDLPDLSVGNSEAAASRSTPGNSPFPLTVVRRTRVFFCWFLCRANTSRSASSMTAVRVRPVWRASCLVEASSSSSSRIVVRMRQHI